MGRWAQGAVLGLPHHQDRCGENLALFISVTEWVLAGQQTAICKHHEGKHQSTLDFFFFIIFFFFVNTL